MVMLPKYAGSEAGITSPWGTPTRPSAPLGGGAGDRGLCRLSNADALRHRMGTVARGRGPGSLPRRGRHFIREVSSSPTKNAETTDANQQSDDVGETGGHRRRGKRTAVTTRARVDGLALLGSTNVSTVGVVIGARLPQPRQGEVRARPQRICEACGIWPVRCGAAAVATADTHRRAALTLARGGLSAVWSAVGGGGGAAGF